MNPSSEALLHLHEEAAEWYIRRLQPGWTAAEERAMQAWLAADPQRRAIVDALGRTWQQAEGLKTFQAAAPGGVAQPAAARTGAAPTARLHRRALLVPALAAAGAALVAGGWLRWDAAAQYRLDVATGPDETRSIDLPDGSRIDMNVASTLRVHYTRGGRAVELAQGEAFFRVAADAAKPFTVRSGISEVRVVGTAFNVLAAPKQLQVQVQHGRVEVRPDPRASAGPVLLLAAGTGVGIDRATGRHQSLPTVADQVGSWRSGQVYFSRATLAEVAVDLARYLGTPVEVVGADVQALRVSGFLVVRTAESFLRALGDVVPVRVEQLEDGSWRVSGRGTGR